MSSEPPSPESRTLKIDFAWSKFKTLISEANNPDKPVYKINYQILGKPDMIFYSMPTDTIIGNSTLHMVSINAEYALRGQSGKLTAQKRFKTVYTYPSLAFAEDTKSSVTMTWTGDMGAKWWDFVCVDESQMPVAKLSLNIWAVKKLGKIEFMGDKAFSDAVRDEIVVTGMTLMYNMVLRMNNIFQVFGATFSRPGHKDKKDKENAKNDQVS